MWKSRLSLSFVSFLVDSVRLDWSCVFKLEWIKKRNGHDVSETDWINTINTHKNFISHVFTTKFSIWILWRAFAENMWQTLEQLPAVSWVDVSQVVIHSLVLGSKVRTVYCMHTCRSLLSRTSSHNKAPTTKRHVYKLGIVTCYLFSFRNNG